MENITIKKNSAGGVKSIVFFTSLLLIVFGTALMLFIPQILEWLPNFLEKQLAFMKEKNAIPCTLKSDSNGKIIKYSECFNHISFNKIEYRKEEKSEFKTYETENEYKKSEIGTINIQAFLDISFFHCDSAFKKKQKM